MSKKLAVILGVGILIAGGIFYGVSDYLSYKSVTIVFESPIQKIALYHDEHDSDTFSPITTLDTSREVRLKTGAYYATAEGENISSEKVTFTVADSTSITIRPPYTTNHLATLADQSRAAINEVLKQKYPDIMTGFTVNTIALYDRGEWGGAIVAPNDIDIANPAGYYRVVIKQANGNWEVVHHPQTVLTLANTPNVPVDILKQTNKLGLQ